VLTHIVRDVERSARLQEQHERRLERDAATRAKEVRRTVSVLVGGVVAACEVCCPVCSVVVGNDCFSIRCDQCQRWVHGEKTGLFEPFIYKMHSFTKTGSGQT